MAQTSTLPGIKTLHRMVHVGHSNYRCSCGAFLGVNKSDACRAVHEHREATPFDEWLAPLIDVDDCWFWKGRLDRRGYARVGDQIQVHRFVWIQLVGPIAEGLTLDHLCQVHHCVNPDHLQPVSRGVNALRGHGPAATNRRKTECSRGHRFTPESTYIEKQTGKRHCWTCMRLRRRGRVVIGEHEGDQ
jgi:hypothetical protein